MARTENRTGARLMDRPEYPNKPEPLTCSADTPVLDAAKSMTERDLLNKLLSKELDPKTTMVSELMTKNPRCARKDDQIVDWLRIMSNERFRRLPVTDEDGRITAIFTQGDFVSYTWPDLLNQAAIMAKAHFLGRFHYFLIGGGILIYALAMIVVLSVV